MNENERKTLFEKYLEMPEEELTKMLTEDESLYKEGIYPLLIEAALSRGYGANRDEIIEIINNLISTTKEIEQKVADQTLSTQQRRLFTILPGIAFWYSIFAPPGWNQRKKEALRCQLIGTRNYLLVGLICVMSIILFSNTPLSSDKILLILLLSIPLCGISVYLFFQKKKHNNNLRIDFMKLAFNLFEGTKYPASETEIKKLATNMKMLEDRSMTKLNRRLLEGGRKIWDTFSEHNFAVKLISYHNQDVQISYEPDEGFRRPPDFKIVLGGLTYWIQMKRLSNIERENRQNKIVQKIKDEAKKINIGMFFGCDLAENFSENDITNLIDFLTNTSKNPEEGEKYYFPNFETPKAIVNFWHPNKSKIASLTLCTSGDMEVVEETGLAKHQIKQSLINAASAFEWDVDKYTINFVAMDADKHEDIDLCDAVFGTEFEIDSRGRNAWCRDKDGFFLLPDFSNKVAGVIALKRKERSPVANYCATLYVNDVFKERINDFNKLLNFENVIHFKMRPPMGKGNFDIG